MMQKIKYILKILVKKIFIGTVQQSGSLLEYNSTKNQIINYHMSSVFPDKQTKDMIMNNLSRKMIEDSDVEEKDA